jgi:S-disulfanyl-L-cysteine oxidoreductase SoxD
VTHRFAALAVLTAVVVLPVTAFVRGTSARPPVAGRTVWDSVFTAEQAARGQATYGRTCSRCHQPSLGGADESPALTGGTFLSNWDGHTMYELHDRVMSSMPTDTPGTYKPEDVADVLAYVLSVNGFPAGKMVLPFVNDSLKAIAFVTAKP